VLAERMRRLYGWTVKPDAIVLLPGVIPGFNLACRALCQPHDAVVVFPPVYPPMLRAPANAGLDRIDVPLRCRPDLHYTPDFDGLAAALTPQARMLMLCNPHNPVGRVLLRDELQRLANICLRHDLYICSDEIHCDLLFSRQAHIPIASLSPEIEARAVTVMAPSKTFNIPGLKLAFAVIPDATLRARFEAARADQPPDGVGARVRGHLSRRSLGLRRYQQFVEPARAEPGAGAKRVQLFPSRLYPAQHRDFVGRAGRARVPDYDRAERRGLY